MQRAGRVPTLCFKRHVLRRIDWRHRAIVLLGERQVRLDRHQILRPAWPDPAFGKNVDAHVANPLFIGRGRGNRSPLLKLT